MKREPHSREASEAPARREFLSKLAVTSAALGLAVTGTATAAPPPPEPASAGPQANRYHKSEHIRAYYATCR